MWKLLSKASIAAAAAALAVTTMSAPANAEASSPADTAKGSPSAKLDGLTSFLPTGESAVQGQQAQKTLQGTPVPLPRPMPEGNQSDDNTEQADDKSMDAVALPKELLDKLPQSGVVPPELSEQVRALAGDRLDRFGSIELPNRRLSTAPNGDLVLIDPENAGQGDKVASADRPVQAQQKGTEQASGTEPAANLGKIVQNLLRPDGPLAGLQGLNGGTG